MHMYAESVYSRSNFLWSVAFLPYLLQMWRTRLKCFRQESRQHNTYTLQTIYARLSRKKKKLEFQELNIHRFKGAECVTVWNTDLFLKHLAYLVQSNAIFVLFGMCILQFIIIIWKTYMGT